jgi:hypothetical protein
MKYIIQLQSPKKGARYFSRLCGETQDPSNAATFQKISAAFDEYKKLQPLWSDIKVLNKDTAVSDFYRILSSKNPQEEEESPSITFSTEDKASVFKNRRAYSKKENTVDIVFIKKVVCIDACNCMLLPNKTYGVVAEDEQFYYLWHGDLQKTKSPFLKKRFKVSKENK